MYGEVLREYDPILVENPRGYNSRMHHLSDLAALPAHVESSVAFPELLHDLVRLAPSDIIDWDESNRFVVVKNIDRFIGLLRNSFGGKCLELPCFETILCLRSFSLLLQMT
jgi:hypothetical protein